jgi:hypothetical protein
MNLNIHIRQVTKLRIRGALSIPTPLYVSISATSSHLISFITYFIVIFSPEYRILQDGHFNLENSYRNREREADHSPLSSAEVHE